jgi:hypothetical protein
VLQDLLGRAAVEYPDVCACKINEPSGEHFHVLLTLKW